jgi:hypothetical protein
MNSSLSLNQYLWSGAVRFGLTSTAVFATVAFGEEWLFRNLGVAGAYAIWISLFMILGASLLRPLANEPGRGPRFHLVFAAAFFAYAVGWIASYYTLRGVAGEAAGTLSGAVLMGVVFGIWFDAPRALPRLIAVLFAANCTGYFAGRTLFFSLRGALGMLLFGIVYGLVFGTGLGVALHTVRSLSRTGGRPPTS